MLPQYTIAFCLYTPLVEPCAVTFTHLFYNATSFVASRASLDNTHLRLLHAFHPIYQVVLFLFLHPGRPRVYRLLLFGLRILLDLLYRLPQLLVERTKHLLQSLTLRAVRVHEDSVGQRTTGLACLWSCLPMDGRGDWGWRRYEGGWMISWAGEQLPFRDGMGWVWHW